jgi:hypothetical protein
LRWTLLVRKMDKNPPKLAHPIPMMIQATISSGFRFLSRFESI